MNTNGDEESKGRKVEEAKLRALQDSGGQKGANSVRNSYLFAALLLVPFQLDSPRVRAHPLEMKRLLIAWDSFK